MQQFAFDAITQIETDDKSVYAFEVAGHFSREAAEALAEFMNGVFDKQSAVSMLLDMSSFTGSDWDNLLDPDVIESRWRSLLNVDKYAVVGAPKPAGQMIDLLDALIPVDARAFDVDEMDKAWQFVYTKKQ